MQDQQSVEMTIEWRPIIRIFCSYAHQNENHRDHLVRHLSTLQHLGYIEIWHDRAILPGTLWDQEIHEHLNTVDLFVPLVSSYFLSSRYCWGVEMSRARERWEQGEVSIVPILVDPVDCQGTPISKFQLLPIGVRAISEWSNRERAYAHVSVEIRKVILPLLARKRKRQGDVYRGTQQHELALKAYEEAIGFDPHDPSFHVGKGSSLSQLRRYKEAIKAYDEAIRLDPNSGQAYLEKGDALLAFAPLAHEEYVRLAEESYQRSRLLKTKKSKARRQKK